MKDQDNIQMKQNNIFYRIIRQLLIFKELCKNL